MIGLRRRDRLETVRGQRYAMGTLLMARVTGRDRSALEAALKTFFETVRRLEERLSIYQPESEISRINRAAGEWPIAVSAETFAALRQALDFAHLTDGAFDPTVQPLTRVWGFDGFPDAVPPEQDVWQAQARVDYRRVVLDAQAKTVFLPERGMGLDLGAIGKGFALDCAAEQLQEEASLEQIRVDFGGQLLFWNREGTFPAETVAIENPDAAGELLREFPVASNASVSTSSNAERFFLARPPGGGDFKRYGHLLDPRRGQPAEGTASVTVVAPTGAQAEALSTALFVRGVPSGWPLLEKCPGARAYVFAYDATGCLQQQLRVSS